MKAEPPFALALDVGGTFTDVIPAERSGAMPSAAERRRLARAADMLYERQGVELTVPLSLGPVDAAAAAHLFADFHALHERLYTVSDLEAPVQIVNFRLERTGLAEQIALSRIVRATRGATKPYGGGSHWLTPGHSSPKSSGSS